MVKPVYSLLSFSNYQPSVNLVSSLPICFPPSCIVVRQKSGTLSIHLCEPCFLSCQSGVIVTTRGVWEDKGRAQWSSDGGCPQCLWVPSSSQSPKALDQCRPQPQTSFFMLGFSDLPSIQIWPLHIDPHSGTKLLLFYLLFAFENWGCPSVLWSALIQGWSGCCGIESQKIQVSIKLVKWPSHADLSSSSGIVPTSCYKALCKI